MEEALQRSSDAVGAAVKYLQAIKITEIRQTLEFLGVQHVEVLIALLFFVMLQFTKFTAVLMLACMIAYAIFYKWDTWFPEIREGLSGATQNVDYGHIYGSPYWTSYGPSYGPSSVGRDGYSSSANSNYDYTNATSFANSNRDARTSALFPPYSNSENGETLPGDHMYDTEEKHIRRRSYLSSTPPYNPPVQDRSNQRKIIASGANTPVGHRLSSADVRPQRRPATNPIDDNRYARRDPLAFRRLIANDYRMYRPTTSTDVHQYHNYTIPIPEERARRLPGLFDEYRLKNRRNNEKRPSTHKKYYGSEQFERLKNVSRENILNRSRNTPGGSPIRLSGPHGRSNAGNYYNSDSSKNKERK